MINHLALIGIVAIALPLTVSHVASVEVPRIRGISILANPAYTPNLDFECLDGSRRISFDKVNDDYCDCGDGSDEPGTAACSNGSFYCQNTGYKPLRIPSGRVNDGICDCCDTSDEYASGKECTNTCRQLGKEASAEAEKAAELSREGNKLRLEMVGQGKKLKGDYSLRLTKLKSDYLEAELLKQEKETIRNEAEGREKIALEKYKPAEPEPTQTPQDENVDAQLREAQEYFKILDKDESGTVTIFEVLHQNTFDRDGNGIVTDEEARYFLAHQDEVNFQQFLETVWINMKPFVMREQGTFEPPSDVDSVADNENYPQENPEEVQKEHYDHINDDVNGAKDEDDDEEEFETDNEHDEQEYQENTHDTNQEEEKPQIEYDPETQAIVDETNEARTQYHQAEKAVLDFQNEMRRMEGKINRDYGPDDVFASLDDECFQYTNFEYVYTMCMYGRTTQSAKSGGSEVLLGHWHEWSGNENNLYAQMKYTGGSACWNGPTRSSIVDLRCGVENKLVSVAEPRRCEYTMIFETPAVCYVDVNTDEMHDEL